MSTDCLSVSISPTKVVSLFHLGSKSSKPFRDLPTTPCVVSPSSTPTSASPRQELERQNVLTLPKLLCLQHMRGPSSALLQRRRGGADWSEMRQRTTRAVYCGTRQLLAMPITPAISCQWEKDLGPCATRGHIATNGAYHYEMSPKPFTALLQRKQSQAGIGPPDGTSPTSLQLSQRDSKASTWAWRLSRWTCETSSQSGASTGALPGVRGSLWVMSGCPLLLSFSFRC